jgi:anaerobic magnesium-protoporphyrin IX monomethyl ester cyclase
MKTHFVYMGAENLGIEYLGACARAAGHEVSLSFDPAVFSGRLTVHMPALARFTDLRPRIIKRIIEEQPDVAAFSCFSGNYHWALSIAERLKSAAPGIKTLFGGAHVTAMRDQVIAADAVDAIIAGEADASFPRLLSAWENPNDELPPGVWLKRDGQIEKGGQPELIDDLDTLPFPAKDLFYEKAPALADNYMIMTMRGCPFDCTFCYNGVMRIPGNINTCLRRRSVANVISELESAIHRRRPRMIVFRDDIFTLNIKWMEQFATEYAERIGIPYFCYSHPASLNDHFADLLLESGCRFVIMGVQSADDRLRREVLNRHYSNEQIIYSASLLKQRGITIALDHIIGFPGDNVEALHNAAVLYNGIRPDRLLPFWMTYYPATEIIDIALKNGQLNAEDVRRIESGDTGHRYSSGSLSGKSPPMFHKMALLLAMIPVLPAKWIDYIIARRLYRFFSRSTWLFNLLLFMNAARIRDVLFFYMFRFYFSKKYVP